MTALDWRSRVDAHQNWSILCLPLVCSRTICSFFHFSYLPLSLSLCLHTNNKPSNLPFFIINPPFPPFLTRQLSYSFIILQLAILSSFKLHIIHFPSSRFVNFSTFSFPFLFSLLVSFYVFLSVCIRIINLPTCLSSL